MMNWEVQGRKGSWPFPRHWPAFLRSVWCQVKGQKIWLSSLTKSMD